MASRHRDESPPAGCCCPANGGNLHPWPNARLRRAPLRPRRSRSHPIRETPPCSDETRRGRPVSPGVRRGPHLRFSPEECPTRRRLIGPRFGPLPAVAPGSRDPTLLQSHRRAAAKTSRLFWRALCRPPIPPVLHAHRVGDHEGIPWLAPVPASTFRASIGRCPARLPHSRAGPVHSRASSAPSLQAAGAIAAATSLAALSARPSDPGPRRSTGLCANENSSSLDFPPVSSPPPRCCRSTSRQTLRLSSHVRCDARRSKPTHFRIFSAAGSIQPRSNLLYLN